MKKFSDYGGIRTHDLRIRVTVMSTEIATKDMQEAVDNAGTSGHVKYFKMPENRVG